MRFHPAALMMAAALPLCGFGSCSKTAKPDLPRVVHVQVERIVEVPKGLTARCGITRAQSRTVEAVVSAYNANVLSLQRCNNQLGEIEGLAGKKATP